MTKEIKDLVSLVRRTEGNRYIAWDDEKDCPLWVQHWGDFDTICLDADFTLAQLEALVALRKIKLAEVS